MPENTEGEKWSPSNSFELLDFMDGQCERCSRFSWTEPGENECALVNQGMDAGIGIGGCPDEWRVIGRRVFCTARSPAVKGEDNAG